MEPDELYDEGADDADEAWVAQQYSTSLSRSVLDVCGLYGAGCLAGPIGRFDRTIGRLYAVDPG